jgi:hypothetical protein
MIILLPKREKCMYTRRQIVKLAAATPLVLGATTVLASREAMKDRIARVIREYSEQGIHRSGTAGDLANAAWLSEHIKSFGLEPELDQFDFRRVRPLVNTVAISGKVVEAISLYDCTFTDGHGITGRIGEIGSDADIGVVTAFPNAGSPGGQALMKARKEGRHKAIIVITDERMPAGIAISNAEDFTSPFGPPTVQVSNADADWIQKAAASGIEGTVVAHCDYVDARGINVGATIRGSSADLAPLVIMTPRSGWWACASERGGGIAAWLEMIRAISASGADRDVIFTANTGHELGHIGLDHYLDSRRALIKDAAMWIHLGANFATAVSPGIAVQSSDEQARKLAFDTLSQHQLKPDGETPPGQRPLGEARNIYDGAGRYISLLGRNGLFHHPSDTWPGAVDLEKTNRWVGAFTEIAVKLSQSRDWNS